MKTSDLLDYCDALATQHGQANVLLDLVIFDQLVTLIPEKVDGAVPRMQGRTLKYLTAWARAAVEDAVANKLTAGLDP